MPKSPRDVNTTITADRVNKMMTLFKYNNGKNKIIKELADSSNIVRVFPSIVHKKNMFLVCIYAIKGISMAIFKCIGLLVLAIS